MGNKDRFPSPLSVYGTGIKKEIGFYEYLVSICGFFF